MSWTDCALEPAWFSLQQHSSVRFRAMLAALGDHEGSSSTADFFRALALQLEWRYRQNRRKIRRLLWAFELGIVCLVLEVAAWLVVLWRQ
jgi:hypothetical protein